MPGRANEYAWGLQRHRHSLNHLLQCLGIEVIHGSHHARDDAEVPRAKIVPRGIQGREDGLAPALGIAGPTYRDRDRADINASCAKP